MFDGKKHRMSIGVLETLISQALCAGVHAFSWQGGVPTLRELVESDRFKLFAKQKSDVGPACQSCLYVSKCNGGCQKHRVVLGGEITQPSYFCKAYKRLFAHTESHLPGLLT